MADELDLAQQHEDMHRTHAIAAITRPRPPGRTECRTCGEPITQLRTNLGAQLSPCPSANPVASQGLRKRPARHMLVRHYSKRTFQEPWITP